MTFVQDILAEKGNAIWSVACQTSVREALAIMAEKRIGALVVLDTGNLVGMFSERDYARKAISIPNFNLDMPVETLMTRRVFFAIPAQTVDECMAVMTQKNVRHLPVMDESVLVGMVSIGDVVKHTLSEMDNRIKDLEEYLWIHLI